MTRLRPNWTVREHRSLHDNRRRTYEKIASRSSYEVQLSMGRSLR